MADTSTNIRPESLIQEVALARMDRLSVEESADLFARLKGFMPQILNVEGYKVFSDKVQHVVDAILMAEEESNK